jgi:hypothetical protein
MKIFPSLALAALKANSGGAWRVWEFARSIDRQGSGAIYEADLRNHCNELKVNGGTYKRWLKQAIDLGLFISVSRGRLVLIGIKTACLILECKRVDTRRVEIPNNKLVGKGWRAWIWAAYEMEFKGRPISRKTQYQLTGKHPETQRRYDNAAGVIRKANYAKGKLSADYLASIQEFDRRAAPFVMDGVVWWRLPDARFSKKIKLAGKGMSGKINKTLRYSGISKRRDAGDCVRLFCENEKELKSTLKKISHSDRKTPDTYLLQGRIWLQS